MPDLYDGGRRVRDPGRGHDGGRAAGGGRARPSSSRCPAPPRPPDAQRRGAGRPGRGRASCPTPSATGGGWPRSSMRCWPIRTACAPCARPPAGTHTPTRPPASPSWSTPMPADAGSPGPLDLGVAPAHPHRRHRRRRHERHRTGAAGHGPPRLGLGPEGLAGGGAAALPRHHGGRRAPARERGRCRRGDVLAGGAAREPRARPRRARRGIRVVPRSEMLAAICATRRCLAVAGTHGKTTTASMLSLILVEAGLRPSFVIGADVNEIGTNAVWDTGEWLVVEADESYGTFQAIRPDLAVLTNVEPDHLDYYGTFDVLRAAFADFLAERRPGRGRLRRRSRGGGHRPGARGDHRRVRPRDRPTRWTTSTCSAARCPSRLRGPEGDAGHARASASPACTTPATRRWPRWRRCRSARPSRRRRRRWPASPA